MGPLELNLINIAINKNNGDPKIINIKEKIKSNIDFIIK
tara:strand:+ start:1132 stop:1248 length:117 start_codon:yes stop_codon:yes gene_type:complete